MDTDKKIDLTALAKQAMLERGLLPDFPKAALEELDAINEPATPLPNAALRDLRNLLWVSIDNDDSKDLDQLTYAELSSSGQGTVYIAIADVDALVKKGSQLDAYAAHNTTSVYTPTKIFPMLPPKLSTNLTSLNEQVDRCVMIVEMNVAVDGNYSYKGIYPAWVCNHAKLAYNNIAAFLNGQSSLPPSKATISDLGQQLKLQDELATRIQSYRRAQGTLTFATLETHPIVEHGIAVRLETVVHNRAHALIENFMIGANVVMTHYLASQRIPTLRRAVKTPERWDRIALLAKQKGGKLPSHPDAKALQTFLIQQQQTDPDGFHDLSLAIIKLIGRGEYVPEIVGVPTPGHFDLALLEYSHTTAPNRRYPDVIMQRLVKNLIYGKPQAYSEAELISLGQICTQRESDATKVERRMRKSAAAMVLSKQLGQEFPAIVTGASPKGTWVRLLTIPVEGKLVQGYQGVDVGDRLNVKLIHVDISLGHIDFSC